MRIDLPASGQSDVSLFLLQPEHVGEAYVAWLTSPTANRYLESRFTTHSLESTRDFVAAALDSPDVLFLGIESKVLGRHVGNIKLGPINRLHQTADIGILIGDSAAWGRGIATAAIKSLTDIAAGELHLRKLTAGCYATNGGSRRAFEKAGFSFEGIRPAQFLLNGAPEDMVLMGRVLR